MIAVISWWEGKQIDGGWKGTWTSFENNKDIGFFINGFWDKDQKANVEDVEKQNEKEVITSELY